MADIWAVCVNKPLPWCGTERLRSLQQLNGLTYPLADLPPRVVEDVLRNFLTSPELMDVVEIIAFAQLVSNAVTRQHVILGPSLHSGLLQFMMVHLPSTPDPTELLYTCAELVEQCPPTVQILSQLLSMNGPLSALLTKPSSPLSSKRGSLRCIAVLCCNPEVPQPMLLDLLTLLTTLLDDMKEQRQLCDGSKYVLSLLKTLHPILLSLSSVKSSELMPRVLAMLKSFMCTGLHNPLTVQSTYSYSLPTAQKKSYNARPTHVTSGDSHMTRPTRVTSGDSHMTRPTHVTSGDSHMTRPTHLTSGDSHMTRPTHVTSSDSPYVAPCSSDSEFSDSSEPVAEKAKFTNSRIRHQVHTCLAAIFQSLDHQTTFSYCQSFLPNALQQQSLLFCVLKDPSSKCRTAAVTVLTILLTGSKPYFGPAKDGLLTAQPYTPYSYTLGAMLRELHWCLLLAATTETNPLTLTQIIKCLSTLVANTPYHQLSDGYITRILSALQPLLNHRDTDVQVAALTCYGSVFSLTPQHCEVLQWLTTSSPSHFVGHCSSLLSSAGSGLAVKTEALQVLTSLIKFYFSAMKDNWEDIGQLYFVHLASAPPSLQLHVLKLLEELSRALSTHAGPETPHVVRFWDQLLTGSLPQILQDPASQPLCSQACSLLSTIGDQVLSRLPDGMRTLVLTLPLGLCKETAVTHHSVCASAVRVLGVFVTYESLKSDLHFVVDCHSVIIHCLSSASILVRVQASWSLGNLTDTLTAMVDIPFALHSPLFGAVHAAMLDNDKVRGNAVRASGNLLRCIDQKALVTCRPQVTNLCALLAKAVVSGGMKCRWNACYACHSAFMNRTLIEECTDEVELLIKSLCSAVHQCKNFKVRINAALALGTPHQYGSSQFQSVWAAAMDGLENSEDEIEFSEYKHAVALKAQLCTTVMHLTTVMQPAHCRDAVLRLPVAQLCKTLAECLKTGKVQPEVLERADANLELLNGCTDVDVLRSMFRSMKITDNRSPSC